MRGQSEVMQEVTTEQFARALNKLGPLPPDAPHGVLDCLLYTSPSPRDS